MNVCMSPCISPRIRTTLRTLRFSLLPVYTRGLIKIYAVVYHVKSCESVLSVMFFFLCGRVPRCACELVSLSTSRGWQSTRRFSPPVSPPLQRWRPTHFFFSFLLSPSNSTRKYTLRSSRGDPPFLLLLLSIIFPYFFLIRLNA